ncbi:hypothetical protein [Candidatus Albibeggiatoa sp. nov. NOAA]|uniref:hypothetical protein n=1 Tax=Candidatus Albibeggiatoa sp. nov. NOAA TaxID=3162724 RepID=UPI0033002755|nr:hypothetical protein [Thiotrichaceae bacterium]
MAVYVALFFETRISISRLQNCPAFHAIVWLKAVNLKQDRKYYREPLQIVFYERSTFGMSIQETIDEHHSNLAYYA